MIVHENVELLSSFVDDELEPPVKAAVESHLADCQPCRHRIEGLRRVVGELQALDVVAPPVEMATRVRRAVLFDSRETGVLRRTEESLRRWSDQPLLLPLFGVVTAMAVLLYLFSAWSERSREPGTRVVVAPPTEEGVVAPAQPRRVGDRLFALVEGRWVEEGLDPTAVVASVDLVVPREEWAALEVFRPLGGRVVLRHEGRPLEVVFEAFSPTGPG